MVKEWLHAEEGITPNQLLIRAAMESVCNTCILTMQDLLGLGNEARMNAPSTTGSNWAWRAEKDYLKHGLGARLKKLTKKYDRLPKKEDPGVDISWIAVGAKITEPAADDKEHPQTGASRG